MGKTKFMNPWLSVLITAFSIGCQLFFTGCRSSSCKNYNSVFDAHSPASQEYKSELAYLLGRADKSTLNYSLNNYEVVDSVEFLNVHVVGDSICAELHLQMGKDWGRLTGVKQTKGIGYHGAGLPGLEFEIKEDSNHTRFVYKSVKSLLD